MKTYSWLIRREFWEFRATWLIPAVVGAVLLISALFGRIDMTAFDSHLAALNLGTIYLLGLAVLFYAVMSIYTSWYLMDCLYNDRRDRSILFWKSLPVSDSQTVLSKLLMGLAVIPLVFMVAADLTSLLMAFVISIRARTFSAVLWNPQTWFQVQVLWLYVIATTAIWYLPIAGWLMLVSAWAKRAVMLWTLLPPLVLYLIEKWFLNTHVVQNVLGQRLVGYAAVAYHGNEQWINDNMSEAATVPVSVWRFINPAGFFSSLEVWIGLAVGVAMIVGTIQLRMRRSEI
ncbi:MAG: type transport system permease protein [Gammaproteobacteria bacterium]|jgi:ABC-2 type transport system permease protein|nr:type transport system permease protein [Gammaproteobacteria bacterium]